ncbi:glycosyltransferase [Pelosinus fermentans]|uniref:Glycosyl transferase family 2 n=1 Tax=Pelosinus fermentans JBW45 TaxID=1192197 RepID=I9NNS4_9FIRM|nr:glycosyltransferase [Pelosinus fermentans]AJQ26100.1 glycosyl transferase family 2 [Pelosinus fermentans JBW45]
MSLINTSIIILTYNKLEYTKSCIESIRQYTAPISYELIVVDNHSTDGTVEWLKEQDDIYTIYNSVNLGFPKGCNQGIAIARGMNILLLNNDVIVTYNWLNNLLMTLYSVNDIGAVGPVTNNCANSQSISVPYHSINEMHQFALQYNISQQAYWEERLKLIGFCLLIKKEVVDKIGLLDEIFSPGNYEDDDYSARIREAGYRLLLCRDTFIHHFGGASFKDWSEEYIQLLKQNRKKFEGKWGYNSQYSSFIRQEIIDLIDVSPDAKIRVLDVGCACGATLLQVKNQYKEAELYGIELNPYAAKSANSFAQMLIADIETVELDYPLEFFDYIILGDVLEHLQNPWEILMRLYKHLAPGGKILASIYNIMHFSVIQSLLQGNWSYESEGILDKAHLRFFTFSEIHKMLLQTGFSDIQYRATRLDVSEKEQGFVDTIATLTNDILVDQFTVYKYIVKASKDIPGVKSVE